MLGYPNPDLGPGQGPMPGYTPPISWMGYPPVQTWDLDGGTPHQQDGGYPIQTWDGVPPPRLGTGYPPDLGQPTPPTQTWDGVPPQPIVNRQTFPSINITFPRTTYAGGKNVRIERSSCRLFCDLCVNERRSFFVFSRFEWAFSMSLSKFFRFLSNLTNKWIHGV